MKRLTHILVIGLMVASLLTSLQAQWQVAWSSTEDGAVSLNFVDSLHGWFTLYVSQGNERILHTTDGGFSFDTQTVPAGMYGLNAIFMEDLLNGWAAGSAYGGGSGGTILRTTDGGNTWGLMVHPAPQCGWLALTKTGNTVLFGGGYNFGNPKGILMKTTDSGASWQVSTYPTLGTIADISAFDEQNFVICGVDGLLARTTNGGESWVTASLDTNLEVKNVEFVNQTLGYALMTDYSHFPRDAYLYKTTDGGFTWNLHYSWIAQGQKIALSVTPNTNRLFVGGWLDGEGDYYGILKSTDDGMSWSTVYQREDADVFRLFIPDIRHGWGVGSIIYRYDYVTPPVIEPISNKLIQFGQPFQYQVNAIGMGLEYSMTGNPAGLNIGNYSGLINGTPTEGGRFDITVAVQDTDANVVNTQFSLRVNRKPVFIPPFPSTHAWVDSVYQFTLSVEDADDDTVDFVWLSKPDWLTFLTAGITSVVISGVPTINDTGDTDISVMTSDGYGGQDTLSWMLHVELYVPGNNAPYFIPPWPDTLAYVDSVYDAILYAEDIDGDSLYFDWLTKPSWLAMLDVMGTARIQGTPAISDTGYHPVSVMVDDNRGGSDTLNWIIQVINIPPPVNNLPQFVGSWPDTLVVYRDSTYNWDFLFQDIDGDTLFTIPGDIGVPGLTLLPGSGVGEVTAIVTGNPTDTGWYTVLVSVKDEHGALGTLQFVVHVDFPTSVEPLPGIPTEFSLEQNYPNPFNPVTIIRYALPHNTEVNLTIYNLLGQEVEVLVNNEYQPIGVYEVSFDASALPSGIYFYRLQAGSYTQTQKMVLQK